MSNTISKAIDKVSEVAGFDVKREIGGNRTITRTETPATGSEQRMQRRDRQQAAERSAGLRAARGRGRGYRSLLSRSRMEEDQGKGTKTTLGG